MQLSNLAFAAVFVAAIAGCLVVMTLLITAGRPVPGGSANAKSESRPRRVRVCLRTHMYAYKRVYGLEAEVKAVAARGDHVVEFAKKHRIATAYRTFADLIADQDIDVVDICTPPNLHASMIVEAMRAGKHVICEKPFAGYFGRSGDKEPIGKHVPKALMYERVMEEMDKTSAAIKASGKLFMTMSA